MAKKPTCKNYSSDFKPNRNTKNVAEGLGVLAPVINNLRQTSDAQNILGWRFLQPTPNKVWVTDITYLDVNDKHYYLVIFMDLFNLEVLGWNLSDSLETEKIVKALKSSMDKIDVVNSIMIHSDQGMQYSSKEYRFFLNENNFTQSMSLRGSWWGSAATESLFSGLKNRCLKGKKYKNKVELEIAVFKYIQIYYNRCRKHPANGWKTPEQKRLDYYRKD